MIKPQGVCRAAQPRKLELQTSGVGALGRRARLRDELYERGAEAERQALLRAAPFAGSEEAEVNLRRGGSPAHGIKYRQIAEGGMRLWKTQRTCNRTTERTAK